MGRSALGIIEASGLACAVAVADAAVKAANVTLIGVENANNFGGHVVKLEGGVAAVQAAVDAGVAVGRQIGRGIYSYSVIPRPVNELGFLVRNDKTKGYEMPKPEEPEDPDPTDPTDPGNEPEDGGDEAKAEPEPGSEPQSAAKPQAEPQKEPETATPAAKRPRSRKAAGTSAEKKPRRSRKKTTPEE